MGRNNAYIDVPLLDNHSVSDRIVLCIVILIVLKRGFIMYSPFRTRFLEGDDLTAIKLQCI